MWNLEQLELEERKSQRTSAIITTVITVILLLMTFLWKAWRQTPPPPGELYEVVGAIDFGDRQMGSRQVNNFEKAVADPAESAPKPQPAAKPVEQAEIKETTPTPDPDPVVTSETPAPIVEPDPEPVKDPTPDPPKPKETVKPKEEKQPEKTTNDTQTGQSDSKEESNQPTNSTSSTESDKPTNKPSGSNQGDTEDGVGNAGTPDIKTLDPEGLYSFGSGIGGGASQRAPLYLPKPTYNVQEEGEVQFEFIIRPDGTVAFVKPAGLTTKPGLVQAGKAAISKWRFTALKPGQAQTNQRVTVTIKFRLKG